MVRQAWASRRGSGRGRDALVIVLDLGSANAAARTGRFDLDLVVARLVAAERAAKRPAKQPDVFDRAAAELRALPVLGNVAIRADGEEFVLLLARAGQDGTVDVVKRVEGKALVDSVVRKAAA